MCTLKKVSVFVLRAAAALEGRVSKVLPLFGELRSKRERVKRVASRTRDCVQVQCLGRASCAVLFGASAVVRYYKPRVEASVSVRHILASKKCHMGLGVDQKCGLRVPGYLAMTVMVPASLCNGVGMQPVSSAALPAVTCPTRTNSIGLICIHMFTLAVLCIRAAVGLPPKGVDCAFVVASS